MDQTLAAAERGWTDSGADFDGIVVGAGISGMYMLHRLRQLGMRARVFEMGTGVGGTWYWNRYPGAACDTESYIYMPLLEETGYIPKRKYATAPELYEHCQRIGRQYGLYEKACFQTVVTEARWDDAAKRWRVKTDRGDVFSGRFVIVAGGTTLGRPKLPGIPGLDDTECICAQLPRRSGGGEAGGEGRDAAGMG